MKNDKIISLALPATLYDKIKQYADEKSLSASAAIRMLCAERLSEIENSK